MKHLVRWQPKGVLKTDGREDELVNTGHNTLTHRDDLMACLDSSKLVVRSRAEDAMAKINHEKPEVFLPDIHKH